MALVVKPDRDSINVKRKSEEKAVLESLVSLKATVHMHEIL
jgi:hypothetical protein